MAAFFAGMAEDRGGQSLGPLALHDLAEADIFQIRKCVQPARVQSRICDDPADQIFQTILCLHCKSSSRQMFHSKGEAIFNSRRRHA